MREKFQRFMMGRYGTDQFNRFLFIVTLVILLVSLFLRNGIVDLIALALLVYGYFRMLSRNFAARSAENERYLRITDKVRAFFGSKSAGAKKFSDEKKYERELRRDNYLYKCPGCGKLVKVPKSVGHKRLELTCRNCGTKFVKNT